MREQPSYEAHGYWRNYQACLPEALRTREEELPEEVWWRWQGHEVHLDHTRPDEARRVKVVLIHGAGGNGRLLMPLATALRRAGYESIAPDLPGFGLTKRAPQTALDYELWLRLLAALVAREREREPDRPVVLFGLSVGGMSAALTCASGADVAGVIATNLLDMSDARVRHESARSALVSRVGGALLSSAPWCFDALPLQVRWVAPLDKMSPNTTLTRLLADDPHIGRASVPARFFRTLSQASAPTGPKPLRGRPLLLAHPGEDAWTPLALSQRVFDRLDMQNKQLITLEGAGHFPMESPGWEQLRRASVSFLELIAGDGSA